MQTFINRDGLSVAWQLDSFAAPWTTPDTVLLLHAAMGSSQRWFRWMPRLAARYRVLRMDLRGHGDTFVYNTDRINDKFELICPLGACTAVLPSP